MVNWYPNSSLLGVNIPSYNGLPLQMGAKLPDWNRSLGGLPFQINHLQGNLRSKKIFFKAGKYRPRK